MLLHYLLAYSLYQHMHRWQEAICIILNLVLESVATAQDAWLSNHRALQYKVRSSIQTMQPCTLLYSMK